MLLVEDIAKDGDTDSQQSSGYVQLDCQYKIRGYYHSFSGAVLFQICYYNKKNGREPLNNQNIINQATGKMNMYRALSTWKFTIYYLLRQKKTWETLMINQETGS